MDRRLPCGVEDVGHSAWRVDEPGCTGWTSSKNWGWGVGLGGLIEEQIGNWASGSGSWVPGLQLAGCHAGQLRRWDAWDFGRVGPAGWHARFGSVRQYVVVLQQPVASGYEGTSDASGSESGLVGHSLVERSLEKLGRWVWVDHFVDAALI